MPKPPRTYERLTRPATSVGSYKTLWLASDHLLIVNSTGYSEEYQRLQLSNIRGFFTVSSDRRLLWYIPWGVMALFSALFLGNALYSGHRSVVSGSLLAVSAILLLWNYLLGPSCVVYVVTGVQTARLPSLVRRRKARKVLARLQPIIARVQAGMVPAQEAAPADIPRNEPAGPPTA
ncbi:MAG TPA: hypothetical protein VN775_11385 [Opitutaceae bacterium]|nr:hypothetical protein [Opitutaceae bacterium]